MSAFHVFRCAERIEATCAEIYGLLGRCFPDDAETAALFTRLAGEERQHEARVRLLASVYGNDPKLVRRVNGSDRLEAALAAAEEALGELRTGGWGSTASEALRRAVRLEEQLVAAHAHLLALNADGVLRSFFEQLASMDAGHLELFRK